MHPIFRVALAQTQHDLYLAQRLRYDVFVSELGAGGLMVDHQAGVEQDRFDPYFDHLLLFDDAVDAVVGVYRVLRCDQAKRAGQFYSEDEYDLMPLHQSGRRLLELGRSCVHPDYRDGAALLHLWNGLAQYIQAHDIEILFGVASFHGTSIDDFAPALSLLHNRHLAPPGLRVRAKPSGFQPMNLMEEANINRPAAMRMTPTLIKSYLRLGGMVGEGAFIDHAFNTTDVFLIMDTEQMNEKQARLYARQTP